jgi:hypothetical protein
MQRFYLVASDPDGEMDAEPREDDLGEWVLHRDAQAEVDRLQSDLRTAIDGRDRAQAEATSLRRLAGFYRSAALCGETLTKDDAEYRAELDAMASPKEEASSDAECTCHGARDHGLDQCRVHSDMHPYWDGGGS